MEQLSPGLSGSHTLIVTSDLTARTLGSGDLDVLGTPALLAAMEAAACDALAGRIDADRTHVGVSVDLEHIRPSKIGASLRAVATLEAIEGHRLTFTCEAFDGDRCVGRARHARAIVDRARFD
jgi:predicted thioesterase